MEQKSTLHLRIQHLETLLLEAHDTIDRQEQEIRVLRHSLAFVSPVEKPHIYSSPATEHSIAKAEALSAEIGNAAAAAVDSHATLYAMLTNRQSAIIQLTAQVKSLQQQVELLQETNDALRVDNERYKAKYEDAEQQIGSIRSVVERNIRKELESKGILLSSLANMSPPSNKTIDIHSFTNQSGIHDDQPDTASVLARSGTLENIYQKKTSDASKTVRIHKSPSKSIIMSSNYPSNTQQQSNDASILTEDKGWVTPHRTPSLYIRSQQNNNYTTLPHSESTSSMFGTSSSNPWKEMTSTYHPTMNDQSDLLPKYTDWKQAETFYQSELQRKEKELDALKAFIMNNNHSIHSK